MKNINLNGTKIMYHIPELLSWFNNDHVYPIQLEISPTNQCNHHCQFCAYDYISRKEKRFLAFEALKRAFVELRSLGTKSVFYSGEGEPLLHPELSDFIEVASDLGFSQAINTNATLLDRRRIHKILPHLEWIRVSVNGPTEESYSRVHHCVPSDFRKVLGNLEAMAGYASQKGLATVIGVQMVYIGQCIHGIDSFVAHLRDIGVHYLAIKGFNQHPKISSHQFTNENEKITNLKQYETGEFRVVLRDNFSNETPPRIYKQCYGMDFYAEITSNGDVYSCGPHLGDKEFCYGNITKSSIRELWSPANRSLVHRRIAQLGNLDNICMPNCRLHEINNFLWNLKQVPEHINFI